VELSVFGPVSACGPHGAVDFTRAKERALLGALALFRGRTVSTDRLIDAVWPDGPPERARKVLQTYVQRVRTALGHDAIETCADGYALGAHVIVDADLFETSVKAERSQQSLRAALARWRGEPYVDLGEWLPAETERTRLAELRDRALETCVALEIDAGSAVGCIAELETMIADQPLRERRWYLLMTALFRDGRVADALQAFQRARKVFAAQLGIDPGSELRALEEQILLADVRDMTRGNLPRQLTSFVGRAEQVAELAVMIRERSVVTLTGVGGVGKTRLALETATSVSAEFRDGAWLCDLAPLAVTDALWDAVAASLAIGQPQGRSTREVVLDYLAVKHLLLVIDNCEHVLVAISRVIGSIARACPHVVVLATSREALALPGEHRVAVAPLVENDALQLFCDRAFAVNHSFALSNDNVMPVAHVCRHLDGIPLAIELAAARVGSLSPNDLVDRLGQRFRLLTTESRSAPDRHQTLRNAIDWSYEMLTDNEQGVLQHLSVFAGGCDLLSAEAVVVDDNLAPLDVADTLSQLVNKSLVEFDVVDRHGRYRLLETIREYARERLDANGRTTDVRNRHLAHYVRLAEEAAPHLRGGDQLAWASVIARETDNFRAAVDWAVESGNANQGLRLIDPLFITGLAIGSTATSWLETVIAIPGASTHRLYPRAVANAAIGAAVRVDLDRAAVLVSTAQEAQARLHTDYLQVDLAVSVLAMFQGDPDRAQHHAAICVDAARASHDPYDVASALTLYAATLFSDTARARVAIEEAVHVARDAAIPSALLQALFTLTSMVVHDEPARARALLDEAATLARNLDDRWAIASVSAYQAGIAVTQEDWATALREATESAEQDAELGGSVQLSATFALATIALAKLQLLESAAVLTGVANSHFPPPAVGREWQTLFAATDQAILDTLGSTRTAQLHADGAELNIADAVGYLRRECDQALATQRS
jgi:predicted ATPase/DNA-binding SARP family transcriptional activator